MPSKTSSSLAFAIAFAGPTSGCALSASTHLPHPLRANPRAVAPNVVTIVDATTEGRNELPRGTLAQRASLVELDGDAACFELSLQALEEDRAYASPKGWRLVLEGSPEIARLPPEVLSEEEPGERFVPGTVERSATSVQKICDGAGQCVDGITTTTYRDATEFLVVQGGGLVCFAHHGAITGATERLTLELDRDGASAGAVVGELFGIGKVKPALEFAFVLD